MEKGFLFVIRAKDINTGHLFGQHPLPRETDQWTDIILTRSNAKKKRLRPEPESIYRCICRAVTFDFITQDRPEYQMRLRILRFKTADGRYENIITNLPDDEFQSEDIK